MAGLAKIVTLLIALQLVNSNPLFKEIKLKKSFDFSMKPAGLRPIAFIKEKWSPFGYFGRKHAIVKRSPIEIAPGILPIEPEKLIPVHVPLVKPPEEVALRPVLIPVPEEEAQSHHELLTDIAQADHINEYLNAVNGIPKEEHVLEEHVIPIVTGNGLDIENHIKENSNTLSLLEKGFPIGTLFWECVASSDVTND